MLQHRYKYPRTFHCPWSPGATSDDKIMSSLDHFDGKRVIVTLKMDGENTSIYRDGLHARSLDSAHHPSRDWVKAFASTFQGDIPEGWRVCGENLYARHSIHYKDLSSYFLAYSIWNECNVRLGWDETLEWFQLLGLQHPEVILDGLFDLKEIQSLHHRLYTNQDEGWVMTLAEPLAYSDFSLFTGKWVRENHVQTDEHWRNSAVVANSLRKDVDQS